MALQWDDATDSRQQLIRQWQDDHRRRITKARRWTAITHLAEDFLIALILVAAVGFVMLFAYLGQAWK